MVSGTPGRRPGQLPLPLATTLNKLQKTTQISEATIELKLRFLLNLSKPSLESPFIPFIRRMLKSKEFFAFLFHRKCLRCLQLLGSRAMVMEIISQSIKYRLQYLLQDNLIQNQLQNRKIDKSSSNCFRQKCESIQEHQFTHIKGRNNQ